MDFAYYANELLEWAARYEGWKKPLFARCDAALEQLYRNGYTREDFERDVAEMWKKHRVEWDPDPVIRPILKRMCEEYLHATPEERARCRELVASLKDVMKFMGGFVHYCATQIRSKQDIDWLWKGLAAVSIENGGEDFRDVMMSLVEIWVRAEAAGINPRPIFREAAPMSLGVKPTHGNQSISQLLSGFHRYGVLKDRRKAIRAAREQSLSASDDPTTVPTQPGDGGSEPGS